MHLRAGLLGGIFVIASASLAFGRADWPDAYNAPIYFYSTNMEAVKVDLTHRISETETVRAKMSIPRAYIIYADGYSRKEYSELPAAISTGHLKIGYLFPDGRALAAAVAGPQAGANAGQRAKVADWRPQRFEVDLYYSSSMEGFYNNVASRLRRQGEFLGISEGLETYRETSYLIFLATDPKLEFAYVRCFEQGNPVYFCTAVAPLSSNIRANINFLDFRFHGGLPFLVERIAAARRIACGFVVEGCDAKP